MRVRHLESSSTGGSSQQRSGILVVHSCRNIGVAIGGLVEGSIPQTFVVHAEDGQEALQHVAEKAPCLIMLDIVLRGEKNGIDVLEELRAQGHKVPVILLTTWEGAVHEAVERGALHDESVRLRMMPITRNELVTTVRELLPSLSG